ncbi:MAG: deaminase [Patescibacteria group bacterium]
MKTIIIAYIPVLHKGYFNFLFDNLIYSNTIYLIGDEILENFLPEFDYLKRKDSIRALPPKMTIKAIEEWFPFASVEVLNQKIIRALIDPPLKIIAPSEDISRAIIDRYFKEKEAIFMPIFLRWHRDNVEEKKKVEVHRIISLSDFEKEIMEKIIQESQKSFDWWRQTSAAVIKNGEIIIMAHNQHLPDPQMPSVFGDPRSIFKRGIHIELSTAEHAEATVIAEAAKRGIALLGTDIFITDFPCPPCAKLIARTGIKKCYFHQGYAVLDGQEILKYKGVELVLVE